MADEISEAEAAINVYLPEGLVGDIVVKPGDWVEEKDELFSGEAGASFFVVKLADNLACKADEVGKFLKVEVGEMVTPDVLLAERRCFWRLKKEFAPVSGKVSHFDEKDGGLLIQVGGREAVIRSPVAGEIEAVGQEKIRIRFKGKKIFARLGHGRVGWGPLRVGSQPRKSVGVESLSVDNEGEVLLVGEIGREALAKAAALSLAGIVCAFMEPEAFGELKDEILKKFNFPFLVLFKDRSRVDEGLLREIFDQIGKQVIVDADKKTLVFPLGSE